MTAMNRRARIRVIAGRIASLLVALALCQCGGKSKNGKVGDAGSFTDADSATDGRDDEGRGVFEERDVVVSPLDGNVTDCKEDRDCVPACSHPRSGSFELPSCRPDGSCECASCEPGTDDLACAQFCGFGSCQPDGQCGCVQI